MIVSVFVRRLKEGRTFADLVAEWEADEGFGVPTRFFNAQRVVGGVGSGVRRWWEVASHHGC